MKPPSCSIPNTITNIDNTKAPTVWNGFGRKQVCREQVPDADAGNGSDEPHRRAAIGVATLGVGEVSSGPYWMVGRHEEPCSSRARLFGEVFDAVDGVLHVGLDLVESTT